MGGGAKNTSLGPQATVTEPFCGYTGRAPVMSCPGGQLAVAILAQALAQVDMGPLIASGNGAVVAGGPRDGLPCPGLVDDLLGPLAPAWDLPEDCLGEAGPNLGRAVLLVDQSKAFERLRPEWVRCVLGRCGVPQWWQDPVLAFISDRTAV